MSNGTSRAGVDTSGHFAPTADNTYSNGTSSLKWSVIYSSTGTINTSDQRAKTPIRTFTDAELRAARVIAAGVGVFQWLAAVEAKGNAARLHAGVAAQAVAAAMKAEGLDPGRYAWWCADHVTSVDDSGVEVESIVYGVRYDQLAMWLIAAQEARLRALEDHAA
jgi:hypothetical protein